MTRHAVTAVWFLLVLATGASWWLGGSDNGVAGTRRLATAALLTVAFVKVRLIVLYFMEVRHAPTALRTGFDAWIVIVCLALLLLYLQAPN